MHKPPQTSTFFRSTIDAGQLAKTEILAKKDHIRMKLRMLPVLGVVGLVASGLLFSQEPSGRAGKSNVAHLYLAEKDATWQTVPGGAWGKLEYKLSGPTFDFVFNAHKLDPGVAHTLMYYPDPWPGIGAICLGSGVVDINGNIGIKGTPDTGNLPIATDWNADPLKTTYVGPPPATGAKIWLVLTKDVACGSAMIGWQPTQYLFEMQLINYTKTP